jgi:hypothetical protein
MESVVEQKTSNTTAPPPSQKRASIRPRQQQDEKIELMGKYSAALSLIEVALGSVLHAFYVPFSGNFLSLNQGYLLCRASVEAREKRLGRVGYGISNVSAVLKSLSPAGKRLGPMLSLSAQGLLFTSGEWLLGANLAGWMLGMVLLSLWTFLQPLLTYYLFFGSELFRAVGYLVDKTLPYHGLSWTRIAELLAAVVLVKAAAAVFLAWLAWRSRGRSELQDRLLRLATEQGARPVSGAARGGALLGALRDLTRPLFLASLGVTAFFLYFSERDGAATCWILLRPVAIGFLFFYFSRTLTLDRWLSRLHGTRGESFARACQAALSQLRHVRSEKNA